MTGFGINDIFGLASYAIRKRKPTVEESIPTVADLEAELEQLESAETAENPPEVAELTDNIQTPEKTAPAPSLKAEEGISEGTACLPCSQDHLSTCSGLLAEALRFARNDGIESPEVISRIGLCRDELNAMERVDLRPELTITLPQWEKQLANEALNGSRDLRHNMADMTSVEDLEKVAANAQQLRRHIGESWLKGRIANMNQEKRDKIKKRALEILDKELGGA